MTPLSPSAVAYARIKHAILNLTYRPGQRLSESMLATELGMGRSPIRTALSRLENEGWVRVQPQSGTFVSAPTPDEIADLAELRLVLEVHAARRAAERIGDEDLQRLRASFEALSESGAEGHFPEFLAFDDQFHSALHQAAGNQKISEMLRNIRDQIHWVRVSNAVLPGRVERSLHEMRQVLEALERRDGDAAAAAMGVHIANIAESFRSIGAASPERAA